MTRSQARYTAAWAAALTCGLALRLWFVHAMPWLIGDVLIYGAIAKNWLVHGVYGFAIVNGAVQPTLIRLPGYPLFEAMCFRIFGVEHYTAVLRLQVLVDLGTCVLVALLAGRLAGRRAAMATLWSAALCPFTANYTAAPLPETLTIFTIALSFYALERWRAAGLGWNYWLWVLAAAMALSVTLRPDQGLLPAVVLPAMVWMAWRRKAAKNWNGEAIRVSPRDSNPDYLPIVVLAVCIVLPLMPWGIRNWRTFHAVQPLAPRSATDPGEIVPTGFDRWFATWGIDFASTDEIYWNYDGSALDPNAIPPRACAGSAECARMQAVLAAYNATQSLTPEVDAQFGQLADEQIREHPIKTKLVRLARLADMWLRPRTEMMPVPDEWWRWQGSAGTFAFALGYALLNAAYLALAVVGLVRWHRAQWSGRAVLACSMLGFVVLRSLLLLSLDNSEPRYTLECWPVVMLLAAMVFARKEELSAK